MTDDELLAKMNDAHYHGGMRAALAVAAPEIRRRALEEAQRAVVNCIVGVSLRIRGAFFDAIGALGPLDGKADNAASARNKVDSPARRTEPKPSEQTCTCDTTSVNPAIDPDCPIDGTGRAGGG